MYSTAQKRSLWDKTKEVTNIGGLAAEKLFDPEFKKIMEQLRDDTDDPVRAIVSGQTIGKANPDEHISLKEILKSSKTNLNRHEYMKSIADLGRFHKKMSDVVLILKSFEANLDKVHHQFLFNELSPDSPDYNEEYAKYLHDIKERFTDKSKKAQQLQLEIIKIAGVWDFFQNVGTERGRALSAWEKRYPSMVREIKSVTNKLLDQSHKLLDITLTSLKAMSSARAERKVEDYIKQSSRISHAYKVYDELFKNYYNNNLKKIFESQQFILAQTPSPKQMDLPPSVVSETYPNETEAYPTETKTPQVEEDPDTRSLFIDPELAAIIKEMKQSRPKQEISQEINTPVIIPEMPEEKPAKEAPIELLVEPSKPQLPMPELPKEPVKTEVSDATSDILPETPMRRGKVRNKEVKPNVPQEVKPIVLQEEEINVPQEEPIEVKPIKSKEPKVIEIQKGTSKLFPEITNPEMRKSMGLEPVQPTIKAPLSAPFEPESLKRENLPMKPPGRASLNHNEFLLSLASYVDDTPKEFAKRILKYAKSIRNVDHKTFIELVNIVKKMGA